MRTNHDYRAEANLYYALITRCTDMNGLLHPCTHPEGASAPASEAEMLANIAAFIDHLLGTPFAPVDYNHVGPCSGGASAAHALPRH